MKLIIQYNKEHDWYIVIFPNKKKRNYGTLKTLLNVISDFYENQDKKETR